MPNMIQAFRIEPSALSQDLVTTSSAAVNSDVCPTGRTVVRITAVSGSCRFLIGTSATAVAASPFLTAGDKEYVLCGPGDRVSVIREGSTDTRVNIAFLSR